MTEPRPPQFESYRPASPDRPQHAAPTQARPPGKRRRRRRPPPPRSFGIGKVFFWLAALVILLAGGITAALFVLSPADLVRSEMIRQVKANTGRTLTIAGTPSLTFYPSIGVSLPTVSLSPPPGMAGAPIVRSDKVHVSVAFAPLFSRRVVVEQVNLVRPVIELRVDRSGRKNWEFASLRKPTRTAHLPTSLRAAGQTITDSQPITPIAAQAASTPGSGGQGLKALDSLELGAITITKGLVQYIDERAGSGEVVTDVNVKVTGKRISDPLALSGNLTWNYQRLDLTARLTTLRKLLHGQAAKADIALKSNPTTATFNGTIALNEGPSVIGNTKVAAKSFQALMRWTGTELPNGKPLGDLSVTGKLNATSAAVALNGARLKLGKTTANGSVSVRLSGARPLVTANLNISQLDIDKLGAHFSGARPIKRQKPKPLPAGKTVAAQPASNQPPKSIEQILRGSQASPGGAGRFSPQVRGFKKSAGWSKDPIKTSALRTVDADARLKIAGLVASGLAIGQTSLRVKLANGNARADIDDMALYGGNGRGVLTAAPATAGLKIGMNVAVNGISAQPLLKDAADFDMIAGTGRLTAALGSIGASQQAIMANLAGKAGFVFTNGAIVGWNIPQMLRGLQTGQISDFSKVSSSKTDFSELTANFKISRGIANTQDLRMLSPLLRLTGSGNTDLGRRRVDMILRPKLVASLAGQGGQANATGLEIPVRVSGPWDSPKATPDLAGILNNRKAVNNIVGQAKKLRDKFKGKNAGEIVRGLSKDNNLGNAANNLLKNLFKN